MTNDEILQVAKEAELYLDGVNQSMPLYVMKTEDLQRFAAIIEKRTIERCAELQYTRSCTRHGYDKHNDAAAISKLGEHE